MRILRNDVSMRKAGERTQALLFRFSLAVLMMSSISCGHYVGLSDPVVTPNRRADTLRRAFLAIRAESSNPSSAYNVTMQARKWRNGPELDSITGATFVVNGKSYDLSIGFPYNRDELRLGSAMPVLSIRYISPEQLDTGVDIYLDPPNSFKLSCRASKEVGLSIHVDPPIRDSETIDVHVYRLVGFFGLVATRVFKGEGTSSLKMMSPSEFESNIADDPEIVVEVQRQKVTHGSFLFSDGIELTQVYGPVQQIIKVAP